MGLPKYYLQTLELEYTVSMLNLIKFTSNANFGKPVPLNMAELGLRITLINKRQPNLVSNYKYCYWLKQTNKNRYMIESDLPTVNSVTAHLEGMGFMVTIEGGT